MRIALAIVLVVGIVASLVADYFWRRWIAERKREHQGPGSNTPGPR
jgi:hypothetical protein